MLKEGAYEFLQSLEGHESEVKSIDWDFSSTLLVSCSRDKTVWVWEYDKSLDFSCNASLSGHDQDVKHVRFVPKCQDIASSSYDDKIKIWE